MIDSAENYQISSILKTDSNVRFVIPRYQRKYTWSKDNWDALFDDIEENHHGHFLGSIICINSTKDASASEQEMELVDGQQRLTTISILYAVLHRFLQEHADELSEDGKDDLRDIKRRLILRRTEKVRLSPSYHGQNHDDYRAVLCHCGVLSDVSDPKFAGNRRIFKAFRHLRDRLAGERADGGAFDVPAVLNFLEKLNHASVVKIEVSSHADAYTLFESLNNRGVPLSAIDLIKNKLLAELEQQRIGSLETNFDRWNQLLDHLGENYAVQERFLRQFYNAFKSDPDISVEKVPIATKSKIIHIYQELIDRDAEGTFKRLSKAAAAYARLVNSEHEKNSEAETDLLNQVARIGGAPCYTYLLRLLLEDTPTDQLTGVLKILVSFFVKRSVTDTPPTRDLDRMFMELVGQAAEAGNLVEEVSAFIRSRSASNDLFRQRLLGNMYEQNVGATRFVLCALEEHAQTKETMTDLWQRRGKSYVWTVEHILPQTENIPADWVEMIASGDAEEAERIRSEQVHKLGNLTLSGYNSKLGTMSFEKKRDRTDRHEKMVGYKNGLAINKELAEGDQWNEAVIQKRTAEMVETIVELFDYDQVGGKS